MKRLTLTLLLLLLMVPGLDGKSSAFSNQAAAAGVPREKSGARSEHEYGTEHQINAHAKKYQSTDKGLFPAADPTNEIEVKRLKLIFLLMMSLGHYRAPVQ